jgi:mRNA interferase RelE/StbE
VFISRSAEKQLKKLPSRDQQRLAGAIWGLAVNPWPLGAKKLAGYESIYRLRIGDYRVIYEVSGKTVTVTVLKVGHRKDVYRML